MKKTKIIVVYSSHLSYEENARFTEHIKDSIGVKNNHVVCYENHNKYSLPELYNKALKEYGGNDTIIVFCHNDIVFKTKNWGVKLLNHFNNTNYSILGIAGSTYIPENGVWWADRSKVYGVVEHTDGIKSWVSAYSDKINGIQPVVNIDGLFMAIDPVKAEHGFDESYKGFHFYDLSFCLPNYHDGCDIGVIYDIDILHKSVGQTNDQWEENRIQFVKNNTLPVRHVSEYKLRVLFCVNIFSNLTGSELVVYEYAKELIKLGCEVTIISNKVGEPLLTKAKNAGIKVHTIPTAPNYRIHEGKLVFFKTETEFDIIHINHKPIGELILQMYPNTPAVMHIHSEIIPKVEEPIVNDVIKKYISIRKGVTDYIKSFDIGEDKIVEISNPFDTSRFNTNYKFKPNEKEVVLFIGTFDSLRKKMLLDLVEETKKNNQILWLIGANNSKFVQLLTKYDHVKYFGIRENVEEHIKKCDYTAGSLVGRTTIEGFLCGKRGIVYDVDKTGNILSKKLMEVPDNLEEYSAEFAARKVFTLYEQVIDETWF
mgnify:CR=1 FL=1